MTIGSENEDKGEQCGTYGARIQGKLFHNWGALHTEKNHLWFWGATASRMTMHVFIRGLQSNSMHCMYALVVWPRHAFANRSHVSCQAWHAWVAASLAIYLSHTANIRCSGSLYASLTGVVIYRYRHIGLQFTGESAGCKAARCYTVSKQVNLLQSNAQLQQRKLIQAMRFLEDLCMQSKSASSTLIIGVVSLCKRL